MRIPLDYYRILGLPIQATAEQLRQSHRDRALQLPRREYSEAAIAARKQLLDEAYAVLSDSEQRQAYDAGFLAKSYDLENEKLDSASDESQDGVEAIASDLTTDPYTPSVEIKDSQLVGALLILLELGEYELVLKLGRPYLSSGNISLKSGRFGQPDIVLSDIVLTVAFSCLELGREQWQQGQYENAAESLETGQELLLREGVFASVRGEMQADLYKLRPYRILELLALPETNEAERRQGLTLLRDMLQDRGGIDGTGEDQSGLSVDDFLRFIQQLRGYLVAAEQQTLFEAEARRPSAVATYLAVYALLARGFAQQQPALIRRAKLMLIRLGTRQDVHLEQAVCALLLGQTEEASRALELSQEYESLAFIREHSQGSPDLLPGLCLYGERWLQNEVFPHFRDLAKQQASLKDYFANEQVQAYLEELPNEPEPANQWTAMHPTVNGQTSGRQEVSHLRDTRPRNVEQVSGYSRFSTASAATATIDAPDVTNGTVAIHTAERISQLSPEGRLTDAGSTGAGGRSPSNTPDRKRSQPPNIRVPQVDSTPVRRSGSRRAAPRLDRLMFMAALGVLGMIILLLGLSKVRQVFARNPASQVASLDNQFGRSIQSTAEPIVKQIPGAALTEETAKEVIQTWLTTKSAALGQRHEVEKLTQILVDPVLTQWQNRAEDSRQDNWYFEYQHSLDVTLVTMNPQNPDQAQVEADVTETAELYDNGQPDVSSSYADEKLKVRYGLVRQEGEWRIQEMNVLN